MLTRTRTYLPRTAAGSSHSLLPQSITNRSLSLARYCSIAWFELDDLFVPRVRVWCSIPRWWPVEGGSGVRTLSRLLDGDADVAVVGAASRAPSTRAPGACAATARSLASRSVLPLVCRYSATLACLSLLIASVIPTHTQSHGAQCVESFYQQQIEQQLKATKASDLEREAMIETLERLRLEEIEQDDEQIELRRQEHLELLHDMMLNDAGIDDIWHAMTSAEKQAFEHDVQTGSLSASMIREPWWLLHPVWRRYRYSSPSLSYSDTHARTQGITFIDDATTTTTTSLDHQSHDISVDTPAVTTASLSSSPSDSSKYARVPSEPDALPTLASLSKVAPSPLLLNNLLDILYAYCFVQRLYLCDWDDAVVDAAQSILALSSILSNRMLSFETPLAALHHAQRAALQPPFDRTARAFSIALLADVAAIVRAKRSMLAALNHLHSLLASAIKMPRQRGAAKQTRQVLRAASHKVYFMMAWLNERYEQHIFDALASVIDTEHTSQRDLLQDPAAPRARVPADLGPPSSTINQAPRLEAPDNATVPSYASIVQSPSSKSTAKHLESCSPPRRRSVAPLIQVLDASNHDDGGDGDDDDRSDIIGGSDGNERAAATT